MLWLGAMLASLPLFIATIRKLQALSMLLSEMTFRDHSSPDRLTTLRVIVSNTTLFTGVVGLGLLVLLLSSALLPPWQIAIVLVLLAVLIALLLQTFFIRIYSRAQLRLQEVLTREPPPPAHETAKQMPALLEEAEVLTLRITANSPVLGKAIRETQLRTRTGATVVVIKRGEETIINPSPDVTFILSDQVLLLGSREQLEQAEESLANPPDET